MIDEIRAAAQQYQQRWDACKKTLNDSVFFDSLVPNSVGWKVASTADFDVVVKELRTYCDRVVHVWLNERWIAKCVLREPLTGTIRIVKLMQVRPGSTDALGLDHVDFYTDKTPEQVGEILAKEDCKTSVEANQSHHKWTSIWFDGIEAKIKDYTVLDIEAEDLGEISAAMKS